MERHPATSPEKNRRYSLWYVLVAVSFTTCLITSNIIAVKLIQVSRLVLTAGIIVFPLSYIFGDILTEVYGYREARRVIWLGFFLNLFTVLAVTVAGMLPAAPFWGDQDAYDRILGFTPRLLLASFAAYLAGEFANSYVLAKMKIATRGRWLWLRTIGSTLVGQFLDSVVFMAIAFGGAIPLSGLLMVTLSQWLVKSAYEALITPLTYLAVNFLKTRDKSDVYDHDTRFNPLFINN